MIIIVFGLPATGKSWFSRKLSLEMNAVHLNTDKIREAIGKKGDYDKDSKQEVYDELKRQARKEIENNNKVIIDGTFHKKARRTEFIELGEEMNIPVYLVELKASETTILNRLKEKRKYSEADYEVYRKLRNEFESPDRKHLTIENNGQNGDELIKTTQKYIQINGHE